MFDDKLPPPDVLAKVLCDVDWAVNCGGESFRCEAPIKEQSAGEDNLGCVEQLATKYGQLMFRGTGLSRPVEEYRRKVVNLVLRKSHGISVSVVQDAQAFAHRTGRRHMAWCFGQV